MARFLSPEWVTELNAAAERLGPILTLPPGGATLIAVEVAHHAGYRLLVSADGVRAALGVPADADVVFTCDYDTAVALATTTTSAQQALMDGRLHVHGSVERLTSLREYMTVVGDVFAAVRAATDFSAP